MHIVVFVYDDFFQPSSDSEMTPASPESVGGVGVAKQPKVSMRKAMGGAQGLRTLMLSVAL